MESGAGEIILLTTLSNTESAAEFARALVEARLAACATVLPEARSFYRWGEDDAIHHDRESVLLVKTHREKLADLEEFFHTRHPYDCPELVVVDIAGLSPAYRDWLRRELGLPTGGA